MRSILFCRFKAVATAGRRHLQMKRRVLRMRAIIDQRFRRIVAAADLHQLRITGVLFAEMSTKPTLSVVKL